MRGGSWEGLGVTRVAKRVAADFTQAGGPAPYTATWRFGDFELVEARRELRCRGELRRLDGKTLSLLMFLLRRPNEVVTKDELVDGVWAGRPVTDAAIAQAVARLRGMLGDHDAALIGNVAGVGYRFLGQPQCRIDGSRSVAAPAVLQAGESPPGRPGWRLIERLGSSGNVWKVQQARSLEVRVFKFASDARGLGALKREITIHRVLRSSLDADSRFLPVFDWNLEEAPYYLEYPYLAEGSLQDWLQRQGGPAQVPLAVRLEILARVAETTALAHSVGVLHKDIKPSNVLVLDADDAVPRRLCLADFGCGLVLDPERLAALSITRLGLTLAGELISDESGTLQYLAPEVIAGKAPTQQSDIYALGVMLFQLAAGDLQRPLLPGWQRAVEDELLREDIAAAADQDPSLRLADANELARRLRTLPERRARRLAEHEAAQRLRQAEAALQRSRQRRPWFMGLAASLLAGSAASLLLYAEALNQRQQTEQALAESQAVVDFLNDDLLGAANPLRAGGGRHITVASLLDTAAQSLQDQFAEQPNVERRLAFTLARSYQNLGLHAEARALLKGQLAKLDDADGMQAAELNFLLADIDTEVDEYQEAQSLLDNALATLARHGETYSLLGFDVRLSRAWLDFELGWFERSRLQFDAIIGDLQQYRPEDTDALRTAQWWMVDSLIDLRQFDRADLLLAEVLRDFHKWYGEDHARYLWARMSLGNLRLVQGRYEEAERILDDVASRIRSSLGEGHNIGVFALYFRGLIRMHQGRVEEALPLLEEAYRLRNQYNGPDYHSTRLAMNRLGEAYLKLGRVEQGAALLERAYGSSLRRLGADHPYTLQLACTLTQARLLSGRTVEAEALAGQALAHLDARLPPGHLYRGHALLWWAAVQLAQGKPETAKRAFDEAAAVFRENGTGAVEALHAAEAAAQSVDRPPADWLRRLTQITI